MKLQRILSLLPLLAGLLASAPARADLKGAFDGLYSGSNVTATKPGRFTGSVRSGWTGGSIDVRFPQTQSAGFISIDPPRLPQAGCGGISAHFGGFSFIDGEQIEGMINNLANGAKGVAINLAIKTLCPMCQNVISEMTNLAQQAAKSSVDACKIGQNLATQALEGKLPTSSEGQQWQGFCTSNFTAKGSSADWLAGYMDTACKTGRSALKTLNETTNSLEGAKKPGGKAAGAQMFGFGNITWNYLRTLSIPGDETTQKAYRELLLNMLGTKIVTFEDTDEEPVRYPATLIVDPKGKNPLTKDLFKLFMCGSKKSAATAAGQPGVPRYTNADAHCAAIFTDIAGASTVTLDKYYTCPDQESCLVINKGSIASNQIFAQSGFLYYVTDVLFDAVDAVVRDDAGFYGSEKGKRFIAMANSVPFPLYQAVNIAAVNPVGGASLVQTLSIPIAETMVMEYFDNIVLAVARSQPMKGVDDVLMEQVQSMLSTARNSMDANRKGLTESFQLQQAILEQIRVANLSVQREVMTPELLNSGRYANVINNLRDSAAPASGEGSSGGEK